MADTSLLLQDVRAQLHHHHYDHGGPRHHDVFQADPVLRRPRLPPHQLLQAGVLGRARPGPAHLRPGQRQEAEDEVREPPPRVAQREVLQLALLRSRQGARPGAKEGRQLRRRQWWLVGWFCPLTCCWWGERNNIYYTKKNPCV